MLTKDEEKIKQHNKQAAREAAIEGLKRNLLHDIQSNTVTVEPDAGYDVSSMAAQLGRPMSCDTVIAKLKQCNGKLHFERSINFPHLMGIYLLQDGGKKHICGMEATMMPEFSVLHKTKKRVADPDLLGNKKPTRDIKWKEIETFASETRGWRTVLVRLLHGGFITEGDVAKHFGWTPSRDSKKWSDQTK